jgi:hypothetical protein
MFNKAVRSGDVHAVWNTGRGYSEHNQRMSAQVLPDGRVAFFDIDRNLDGLLHQKFQGGFASEPGVNPGRLASFVMAEYDDGRYNSGFYELQRDGQSFESVDALTTSMKDAAKTVQRDGKVIAMEVAKPVIETNPLVIAKNAALVLQGYPNDQLVSEWYDHDDAFSGAINDLFQGEFEYPTFSHRKIGEVVKIGERELAALAALPANLNDQYADTIIGNSTHQMDDNVAFANQHIKSDHVAASLIVLAKPGTGLVYHMQGTVNGEQQIHQLNEATTNAARLLAHWKGFVENMEALRHQNPLSIVGDVMQGIRNSEAQVERVPATLINVRYAETIIGSRASEYDALEVHGVRDLNEVHSPEGTACQVDDENPQFFSVYAHVVDGGVECVGDFSAHAAAVEYAGELSASHGWPVVDHSLAGTVLAQSHRDAEAIAVAKGDFGYANVLADQIIAGSVMGVTNQHIVVSLGRAATIIAQADLNRVPAAGEMATISFKGGKGVLADLRDKGIDNGR